MGWQDKVAEEFNRSFNIPFMPEGFCVASVKDGVLWISLGDRDVGFAEDGHCVGSGSCVGCGARWEISRRKVSLQDIQDVVEKKEVS